MAYEETPPTNRSDTRNESDGGVRAPETTEQELRTSLTTPTPGDDALDDGGSGLQLNLLDNAAMESALKGSDGTPTHEATGSEIVQTLDARDGGSLELADLSYMYDADFVRQGPDLLLVKADGTAVLVENYFAVETPPDLTGEQGRTLTAELIESFLMPVAPGQTAALTGDQVAQAQGESIGSVDTLTGEVYAVRPDGTRVLLEAGDPVYQGDIVETAEGGSIKISFIDDTLFTLGEDAKLALDEMVFDPASQTGESAFSILKGGFLFVSGQIAETNPNDMTVTTPVATIGIRGTIVTGEVSGLTSADGETFRFTVVDGEIAVSAGAQTVVLSENFATVSGQPDTGSGEVRMFDFVESAQNVVARNSQQFRALSPSDLQKIEQAIESSLAEETGGPVDIDLGGIVDEVIEQEQQEEQQEESGQEEGPEDGPAAGEEAPVEGEGEGEEGEGTGEEGPVEGEGEEGEGEGEEGEEEEGEGEEGEGGDEDEGDLTEGDLEGLEGGPEGEGGEGEGGEGDKPPEGEQGDLGDVDPTGDGPGEDGPPEDGPVDGPPEEQGPGEQGPGEPEGGEQGGGGDDPPPPPSPVTNPGSQPGFGGDFSEIDVDPVSGGGGDDGFGDGDGFGGGGDIGGGDEDDGPDLIDAPDDDTPLDTGPISLGSGALVNGVVDRSNSSESFNVDLSGQTTSVTVRTGSGSDSIVTGSGSDTINAGAGNDIVVGGHGGGDDFIDGGDGDDIVTYDSVTGTNTVNLTMTANDVGTLSFISDGPATLTDNDTLTGVERVRLGDGDDSVRINVLGISVDGDVGSDSLNLSTLTTGVDFNFASGATTDGTTSVTFANFEGVTGSTGDDTITLSDFSQTASGNTGTDTLSFAGISSGANITALSDINVNPNGSITGQDVPAITFNQFEAMEGTSGDDVVIADLGNFDIYGGAGTDILTILSSGTTSHNLTLGAGNDIDGIEVIDLSGFSSVNGGTVTLNFSAADILSGTSSGTLQIIGADSAEFNQIVTSSSWEQASSLTFTSGGATLILDANSVSGASDGTATLTGSSDLNWGDAANWSSTFLDSGAAPVDGNEVVLNLSGSDTTASFSGLGTLSLSALSGAGSLNVVDGLLNVRGSVNLNDEITIEENGKFSAQSGTVGTLDVNGGTVGVESGTVSVSTLVFDYSSGSLSSTANVDGSGTLIVTDTAAIATGQTVAVGADVDLQNATVEFEGSTGRPPDFNANFSLGGTALVNITDGGRLIVSDSTQYAGQESITNMTVAVGTGAAFELASGTVALGQDSPALTFGDNSTLTLNGVWSNGGTFTNLSDENVTRIDGTGTLANSGRFSFNGDNVLVAVTNSASGTIDVGETLTAFSGGINNAGTMVLDGTMSASASGSFINSGTIETSDGSKITGTGTLNNSGLINAQDSTELAGFVVNTGTMAGRLIVTGEADTTAGSVNLTDNLEVNSGGTLFISDSTDLTGSVGNAIEIGSQGVLDIAAGSNFTLLDSSSNTLSLDMQFGDSSTLNLNGNARVQGTFDGFGGTATTDITGTGTFTVESNGHVLLDNDTISTTFENAGSASISNTTELSGAATNSGQLNLAAGAALTVDNTLTSTNQISMSSGLLTGTGVIENDGTMNFDGAATMTSVDIDSSDGQISIGTGNGLLARSESTITFGSDSELVGQGALTIGDSGHINLAAGETFNYGSGTATANTVGTADQLDTGASNPDVAILSNGHIVTVWDSGNRVDGNVIDPDAGTIVNSFQIDAAQEGSINAPSVDAMSNGTFRIVYGAGTNSTETTLTTQLYLADGTPSGLASDIRNEPDEIADTDIVALSNDGFGAVMRDESDGVSLVIYDSAGSAQRAIGFSHGSGDVHGRIDLTAFSNDDLVATYVHDLGTATRFITGRILKADGTTQTSFNIASGDDIGPDAASTVLSNGNIATAYTDGGDAYVKVFTAAGVTVTAAAAFNTSLTAAGDIDVSATSDGGFVVTWSANNGSDVDTYAQKFTAAGATDGSFINLNNAGDGGNTTGLTGDQANAIVAAIDDDKFATVFTDNSNRAFLTVAEFDGQLPTAGLTLSAGSTVGGTGTLENDAVITFDGATVEATATIDNDGTLSVGGDGVTMHGATDNAGLISSTGTVTIESSGSLTNTGTVSIANGDGLVINGNASNSGTVTLDDNASLAGSGSLANTGVLVLGDNAAILTGTINSAGGTVDFTDGGFTLSGGVLDITDGTLVNDSSDDTLSVAGGNLLVGSDTEVGTNGAIEIANNGTMTIADGETISITPTTGTVTQDVQVNAITGGDQTVNDMTLLSNGNYVITWEQSGNDFATIVDADGNRVTEIQVTDGSSEPHNPRVTSIGSDRFIVAYYQDAGANEIMKYSIYNNDGSAVGSFHEILNSSNDAYTKFDVFPIGADGYGYITHQGDSTTLSGAAFGTGTLNGTFGLGVSGTIVSDVRTAELQNGNIALVYTSTANGSESVFFQTLTPSNASSNVAAVIPETGSGITGSVDIAVLTSGEAVVVYTDNGHVMAQRYTAVGANIGSAVQVSDSAASPGNPVVVALSNGGFQVLYEGGGTGGDIFSRSFNASGTATTTESVIASNITGEQGPVVAAPDGDGTGVKFAYSSPGTNGDDIFFGPATQNTAVSLNLGSGGTLAGTGTLENTSDITIDGATVESTVHLDNDGTLSVGTFGAVLNGATDNSGDINADGAVTIGATGDLTNSGTVSIASGEGFVVNGTATNSGEFELGASTTLSGNGTIDNTSILTLGDNANVSMAEIDSAGGTVDMSAGGFTLSGGLLDITTGEMVADSSDDTLSVTGGVLQVGSATVLDDDGTVEIASGGTLSVASGDTFTFENATTTTPTTDVNPTADAVNRTVTDMIKLTNGNYVIASESAGNDLGYIVDSNGALVTNFSLTTGAVDDHAPRLAALADGGFVALYNDFNGTDASAFFRVFNSAGAQVSSGSSLGSNTSQAFRQHDIFSIGNDGFGQLNRLGAEQLIRLSMTGTGVDQAAINIGFTGDLVAPVRADEMVNSNIMAVYVQENLGTQEIHTLVIDPTNTSSIANNTIVTSSTITGNIDIAPLTGGGSVLVYVEAGALVARLLHADGTNNGAPITVSNSLDSVTDPVVVALSNGGFQVLYEGTVTANGQQSDIYTRAFSSTGVAAGAEEILATNTTGAQVDVAAAQNADGTGVSFVYSGPGPNSDDIFFGDSNTSTSTGNTTPIDFTAGSTIDGPGTFANTGNLDFTDGTIGASVTFDNDGTLVSTGNGARRLFIDTDNFDNTGGTILLQQTGENSTQLRFDGSTFTNNGKIVLDAGTGAARFDDDTTGGTATLVNTTAGVIEVTGTGNSDSEGGKLLIDTVNQGRIDVGGKLIIENDLDTTNGTISLSTVAASDRLEINSDGNLIVGANTTFEGGGTIRFDTDSSLSVNGGDTFTYTASDPEIVFNGNDQTWSGAGTFVNEGSLTLGDDLTLSLAGFENNGTVGLGGTLSAGASFANDGKLEVGTTGLVLAGELNNDNGTIDVTEDGTLTLEGGGTTSLGGTLDLNGGSEIKASSTNDVLELTGTILSNDDNTANTITADLVVGTSGVIVIGGTGANDGTLEITGSFTNNGFIQVDPNENVSGVLIVQDNFDNTGTLQVDNAATLEIVGEMTNTGTLLGFHAGVTETGIIKGNRLINNGEINLPTEELGGGSVPGVLNGASTSTLTFEDMIVDSTGGSITLGTNSSMIFDGSTLNLSTASVLDFGGGTLALGGSNGVLDLAEAGMTLTNTGNVEFTSGLELTGQGTFLNQTGMTLSGVTIGSTATFENDDGSGPGVIQVGSLETLTVNGSLINDASANFTVGSGGVLDGTGAVTNNATFEGAAVTIAEGLTYTGNVQLSSFESFVVDGSFTGNLVENSASSASISGGTNSTVELIDVSVSGAGIELSSQVDLTQTGALTFDNAAGELNVVGSEWTLGAGASFGSANGTMNVLAASTLSVASGINFAYNSTSMAHLNIGVGGGAFLAGDGTFTNAGGTLSFLETGGVDVDVARFINDASIVVDGGGINFNSTTVTNSGLIDVDATGFSVGSSTNFSNTGTLSLDSSDGMQFATINGTISNAGTILIDNSSNSDRQVVLQTTGDGQINNAGQFTVSESTATTLTHAIDVDITNTGTMTFEADLNYGSDTTLSLNLDSQDGDLAFDNGSTLSIDKTITVGDDTDTSGTGEININADARLNVAAGEAFTITAVSGGGGVTVGSRTGVNQTFPGAQNQHDATTLSNGNVVVTWDDSNKGGMFRIFDASGSPLTGETEINTGVDVSDIKIATLPGLGFVVLTTHEESQDIGGGVFVDVTVQGVTVYDNSGNTVNTPAFTELNSFHFPALVDHEVTTMGTGFLVTTTDDNGDLSFTKFNTSAQGVGVSGTASVDASSASSDLDVTELSNGSAVFSFLNSNDELHLVAINSSGTVILDTADASAPITTTADRGSAIAPLATSGQFILTWGDGTDIKAQVLGLSGTSAPASLIPVSSEFTVNTTTGSEQNDPTVTVLSDGQFVISWTDGGSSDARGQLFSAGGTKVGNEFDVSGALNNHDDSVLTATSNGNFVSILNDNNDLNLFTNTQGGGASGVSVTFDTDAELGGGGNLVNEDSLNLTGLDLLASTTLTNAGSLNLTTDTLSNGGTMTVNGILANTGSMTIDNGTLDLVTGSSFSNTGTLSLTSSSGESALVASEIDVTNDGLIILDNDDGLGTALGFAGSGSNHTLTNAGTILSTDTGDNGAVRGFIGDMVNTGTLDIDQSMTFGSALPIIDETFDTRDGRVDIASGEALHVQNGTLIVGADTDLVGNGTLAFSNGNAFGSSNTSLVVASGETFTYNSTTGPTVDILDGHLLTMAGDGTFRNASGSSFGVRDDNGTLATSLTIQNVGFINEGTLFALNGGDLNLDTTNFDNTNGTILIAGTSLDSDLTIFNNMTIGGLIQMDQTLNNPQGDAEIDTRDNTLTVTGTLLSTSQSTLGTEDHELEGNFVNQGTFDIRHELELDGESDVLDSRDGAIVFDDAMLEIDGTLVLGSDSSASGDGTIRIDGDVETDAQLQIVAGESFTLADSVLLAVDEGTLTGGTLVNEGTISLTAADISLDSLANDGLIHIGNGLTTISGSTAVSNSVSSLGTIQLEGSGGTAQLAFTSNFTNAGLLILTGAGVGDHATLQAQGGSDPLLTNTGILRITNSGTAGNRVLDIDVTNQGTIDVQSNATLAVNEVLDAQAGQITIGTSDTLTIQGDLVTGSLTNFSGDGDILISNTGTVSVAANNTSTNESGGDSMIHFANGGQMAGLGTFANAGTIDITNATISVASLVNTGTMEINEGAATISGTDLNSSGVIDINAGSLGATFALTSSADIGGTVNLNTGTGPDAVITISNGQSLTISGVLNANDQGDTGVSHEIFGDVVNKGRVNVGSELDLNGVFDTRDGHVSIGAGELLDVEERIIVGNDTTISGTGTLQLDFSPGATMQVADGETFTIGGNTEFALGGTSTLTSTSISVEQSPDMTALSNGDYWVAWDVDGSLSNQDEIQRFTSDGTATGVTLEVNGGGDFPAENLQLAGLSNGNVAAVYAVNGSASLDNNIIQFEIFGSDGSATAFNGEVADLGSASINALDAVSYINGSTNGFLVAYADNDQLQLSAFTETGGTLTAPGGVSGTIVTSAGIHMDQLTNGSTVIAYVEENGATDTVIAEIIGTNGLVTNTVTIGTTTAGNEIDVAALTNGNFAVSWTDGTNTYGSYFDNQGTATTGDVVLVSGSAINTQLTAGPDGGVVGLLDSGFAITLGRFNSTGTLVGSEVVQSGAGNHGADVLGFADGNYAVAYSDGDIIHQHSSAVVPVIDLNGKTVDGTGALAIASGATQDVSGVTLAMGGLVNDGTVSVSESTVHANFGTVSGSGVMQLLSDGSAATLNLVSDLTNAAGHTIAFVGGDTTAAASGVLSTDNGSSLTNEGLLSFGDTGFNYVVDSDINIVNTGTISIEQNLMYQGILNTVDGTVTGVGTNTSFNGDIFVGADTDLNADISYGGNFSVVANETFTHDGNGSQRIRFGGGTLTGDGTFQNSAQLDFGNGEIGSSVTFDNDSTFLMDTGAVTISTSDFDNSGGIILLTSQDGSAGTIDLATDLTLGGTIRANLIGGGLGQAGVGAENAVADIEFNTANNSTLTLSGALAASSSNIGSMGILNFNLDVVNTGTLDISSAEVQFASGADLDTRDGTVLVTSASESFFDGRLTFTGSTMTVGADTVFSHDAGSGESSNDAGRVIFQSGAALNVATGETFTLGGDAPTVFFNGGGSITGNGELQNDGSLNLTGAILGDTNTTIDNNGTLRIDNGTLELGTSHLDNTGGLIELNSSDGESRIEFDQNFTNAGNLSLSVGNHDARLIDTSVGGVSLTNTGTIGITGGTESSGDKAALAIDIVNTGLIDVDGFVRVNNNANLDTTDGTIEINNPGNVDGERVTIRNGSTITVGTDTEISGTGTLRLGNGAEMAIGASENYTHNTNSAVLEFRHDNGVATDVEISGAGSFTNAGSLELSSEVTLSLASFINTGTVSSADSILNIDGTFINDDGLLNVSTLGGVGNLTNAANAVWNVASADVIGGLNVINNGTMQMEDVTLTFNGSGGANLSIGTTGVLSASGTIGEVSVDGGTLELNNGAVATNSGEIQLAGNTNALTLENTAGADGTLVNNGTITWDDASARLKINDGARLSFQTGTTFGGSAGIIAIANGGALAFDTDHTLNGSNFTLQALNEVGDLPLLDGTGTVTNTGGLTDIGGFEIAVAKFINQTTMEVDGATVSDAFENSATNGVMTLGNGTLTLTDTLSNAGLFQITNAAVAGGGSLLNTGTLDVRAVSTDVSADLSSVAFTNEGVIQIASESNGANATLSTGNFTNTGTISFEAGTGDDVSTLSVSNGAGTITNDGLITIEDAVNLDVTDGAFVLHGHVQAGTNGGTIKVVDYDTGNPGTNGHLAITGDLTLNDKSRTIIETGDGSFGGNLIVQGTLDYAGTFEFRIDGDYTPVGYDAVEGGSFTGTPDRIRLLNENGTDDIGILNNGRIMLPSFNGGTLGINDVVINDVLNGNEAFSGTNSQVVVGSSGANSFTAGGNSQTYAFYGQGGNDSFTLSTNTSITFLDGGSGDTDVFYSQKLDFGQDEAWRFNNLEAFDFTQSGAGTIDMTDNFVFGASEDVNSLLNGLGLAGSLTSDALVFEGNSGQTLNMTDGGNWTATGSTVNIDHDGDGTLSGYAIYSADNGANAFVDTDMAVNLNVD